MKIREHLKKNSLHHAYLIEGRKDEILPEIFSFFEDLGIKTKGNPDLTVLAYDSLKVDDARALKSMEGEKSITGGKRIFVLSANNILGEAQNTMLKIFEEPGQNVHFFVILPDTEVLLPTLKSRFYLMREHQDLGFGGEEMKKFLAMNLKDRLDFIKDLIIEKEEEENIDPENTPRAKALKFLNSLEEELRKKIFFNATNKNKELNFFEQIIKVHTYLRQPGSSTKMLLESVAIIVPKL